MKILGFILFWISIYFLWKLIRKHILYPAFNYTINKTGLNKIFPNENSQNASISLESNLDFKKELNKLVLAEGGIESFIEKTKFKGTHDPYNIMIMGYKHYGIKHPNEIPSKTIEVVDALLNCDPVKETILKFNLSKKEIDTFSNGLFIGIGSNNFKEDYKKIIIEINS